MHKLNSAIRKLMYFIFTWNTYKIKITSNKKSYYVVRSINKYFIIKFTNVVHMYNMVCETIIKC